MTILAREARLDYVLNLCSSLGVLNAIDEQLNKRYVMATGAAFDQNEFGAYRSRQFGQDLFDLAFEGFLTRTKVKYGAERFYYTYRLSAQGWDRVLALYSKRQAS